MADSKYYARSIQSQLKISLSGVESRKNRLSGMIRTNKINVYTDDWFFSDVDISNPTSYERIESANKKYKASGYNGVPYHYIVTNCTTKVQDNSGIYSVIPRQKLCRGGGKAGHTREA